MLFLEKERTLNLKELERISEAAIQRCSPKIIFDFDNKL